MKAHVPQDITLGQLEEFASQRGLNAVYDADTETLHLFEEDWIGNSQNHFPSE